MSDPIARLNTALQGRYLVERELGEGGMATVYLAHDLKHERKVALKVLKPELAAVVGAERFLAEIKTTANLQHPHILPLFDSGEADAFLFYVMPYVQGETLRERINRDKQLPVDEAVGIATAVAAALQHAHDRGIVHRDIKPANILLQDGQPVVADFGIAIAVGAAGGSRLTETGLSVGTPFYMSPEQATGDQLVGPASDTYSLAALLYEMLTGDPPYIGSTAQAVLGKIIQGAPVSATAIRSSIPRNVDAALRKALERLPADRFTRAQDFAQALSDPSFQYGDVGAAAAPARGWSRATAVATVVAAAATILAGWALTRPGPPKPQVQRYSLAVTDAQFPSEYLSLSADASTMVMTYFDDQNQPRLWSRRWAELASQPVQGAEGTAVDPVISPDGTEVAYQQGSSLKVSPLVGGLVRVLTDDANCCIRWGSDGYIYYAAGDFTIHRVPEGGGEVERVTTRMEEGDGEQGYFEIMPDGEHGVFSVFTNPPRLEAFTLSTGERRVLTTGMRSWVTSTGHIVFGTLEGQILAAPFDADRVELTGDPVPMVQGVGVSASQDVMFTLSANGTLLYWASASSTAGSQMVWVRRSGGIEPLDGEFVFRPAGDNASWSLSPDGSRIAYQDNSASGGDIWIKEADGGPVSRLTFEAAPDRAPRWSPDGQSVYFLSDRGSAGAGVWSMRADGTGEPMLLQPLARSAVSFDVSPDGAWIVYRTQATPSRDIHAVEIGTDREIPLAANENFDETGPAISPDGRWIAYSSNETGAPQVYVRPFPNVEAGRWQISDGPGVAPTWARSGREIFYATTSSLFAAQLETDPTIRVTGHSTLFNLPPGVTAINARGWYDVSVDGQSFLMGRPEQFGTVSGASPIELILVHNFFEELKARIPN
ncbi:MAG: protein kinase [Longimicrobiales bacterium]|nr:protein kinase [Longimicrobiales bacterium]